ncbi:hypothetical protein [Modestobacter sp. VKM Ac-2985]|uniref:hypothetical protein n=1 Tax=Modestobacter sp. VKM Ac-2985 TaxID=3004139 RepID=UPI0022ABA51F|nr:hypothetical protein [Modestobacter sp. VKM Ac-2985]MCZ2837140.1 hypothetical protein [Modestobacter sp. VKM Ac-2985]
MGVRNDWRVNGASGLIAELQAAAARTPLVIETVVDTTAEALVAAVRANATGRPGPEDLTGEYLASWDVEPVDGDGPEEIARSVGTDEPQAHRLEWGFVGTDSLGRDYNQPPYPHMGPASDAIEPLFVAAMDRAAAQAIRW